MFNDEESTMTPARMLALSAIGALIWVCAAALLVNRIHAWSDLLGGR